MNNKIAYISFDRGFLSIHCYEIVMNLVKRGVAVILYVAGSVEWSFSDLTGVKIARIPAPFRSGLIGEIVFQILITIRVFLAIIRPAGIRRIYARQNFAGIGPPLVARLLGVPYIAEVNGIIHIDMCAGFRLRQVVKNAFEKRWLKMEDNGWWKTGHGLRRRRGS